MSSSFGFRTVQHRGGIFLPGEVDRGLMVCNQGEDGVGRENSGVEADF